MAILLWHLLKVVWRARVDQFFAVYALLSALTAAGAAWVVRSGTTADGESSHDFDTFGCATRLNRWVAAPVLGAAVVLACYIVAAIKWGAFADYDESFFTRYTLKGADFPAPIWPNLGRFFPLGDQEFNLLRHITNSAFNYHMVPIAELAAIFCALLFLDDALNITARASLGVVFLLLPGTVEAFGGLVYPDRNVVFWLVCLLCFVKLFERQGHTGWAVAAALSAQNMLYYKETAFLLLFGFAAGRLALRCWRPGERSWDASRLRTGKSRLDLFFLFLTLMFVFYYGSVMMHRPNVGYIAQNGVRWSNAIGYYLKVDFLAIIFVIAALSRAYLIVRRRIAPVPLWDSLAMGGVACYLAYVAMRLCRPYYLVPIDFIAVLYVGRFVLLSWKDATPWKRAAVSAVALVILVQAVALAGFITYERGNLISAKVRLADAILTRAQTHPEQVQRLFFPFTTTYPMQEFVSYLAYRGLDTERNDHSAKASAPDKIVIVSRAIAKDGACPDYREFRCHAGDKPHPGDLVMELPDDLESRTEIDSYTAGGDAVFTYEPRPHLTQSMAPELDYLRVVSNRWRFMPLPDRWLEASITVAE